jgi:hypothetical protein
MLSQTKNQRRLKANAICGDDNGIAESSPDRLRDHPASVAQRARRPADLYLASCNDFNGLPYINFTFQPQPVSV